MQIERKTGSAILLFLSSTTALGVGLLIFSYMQWGLFPLYFAQLGGLNPFELIDYRILLSLVVLLFFLPFNGRIKAIAEVLRSPKLLGQYCLCSLFIIINWTVYVWAVLDGRVMDTAIGYFLYPLITIALARLLLGELQSPLRYTALAFASLAVLIMIAQVMFTSAKGFPWVALVLGFSFSIYGLLRKSLPLGAISGLFVEVLVLTPWALGHLLYTGLSAPQGLALLDLSDLWRFSFVAGLGVVTLSPLFFYNWGARLVPLSLTGILFYLLPTVIFLLGTFYFHEPINAIDLWVFGLIWLSMILYCWSVAAQALKQTKARRLATAASLAAGVVTSSASSTDQPAQKEGQR